MIASMNKAFVVCRVEDRQKLLSALRELGVVHVEPVDPGRAVAEEKTQRQIETLQRASTILSQIEPRGETPDLSAMQASEEVTEIERRSSELSNRLTSLQRQVDELAVWGDVTLQQFRQLRQAGLEVAFYHAPAEQIGGFQADLVTTVSEDYHGQTLVAVVSTDSEVELPDDAEEVELPQRDRPSLREDAARIDEQLKSDRKRLEQLAHLRDPIDQALEQVQSEADFTVASRSGMEQRGLYAIQGWVPQEKTPGLAEGLEKRSVDAAVRVREPEECEQPPTLIEYPKWANPIRALLEMLGTNPGYREFDPSPFFMLAMPIFTAMLVGDAGYGLIFTVIGAIAYPKIARAGAKPAGQLVLVFGGATLIWGLLTANVFGVGPKELSQAGGFWAGIGGSWEHLAVFWRAQEEEGRNLIMKISFIIGCVHLVLAHLRQAVALLPDQRGVAEVGWVGFIFGMFTLVWLMFFQDNPLLPPMGTLWILLGSFSLIVLFSSPSANPLKRVGLGLISNLMGIPGAFGDMLSYIRLMAVGLASYYIANAFNNLAMGISSGNAWLLPATILVLLLAHSLNIGLCLVAIFAHGVRLNMLEFSTNAGLQWSGRPYAPFALKASANEGER